MALRPSCFSILYVILLSYLGAWGSSAFAFNKPQEPKVVVQNQYQPYLEIGGAKYINQSTSAAGIYDLFIPLLQTNGQLFFTDLRVFDRSGSAAEGNIHLGYRKLNLDSEQLFGLYAAYDFKRSEEKNNYQQLTFGFEYWQNQWFIGGNFYKPIGRQNTYIEKARSSPYRNDNIIVTRTEINKYYEKVLTGGDLEIGYAISDNLTSYLGGYYFYAKDIERVAGPKLRLTYDYQRPVGRILGIFDGLSFEGGMKSDKVNGTSAYFGIKFKIGLTGTDKNSNVSGFERHMVELVRRDPDIIIERTPIEKEVKIEVKVIPPKIRTLGELLKDLELPEDATWQEVKKQYHNLGRKNHPDKTLENTDADFIFYSKTYKELKKYEDELKKREFRIKDDNATQESTAPPPSNHEPGNSNDICPLKNSNEAPEFLPAPPGSLENHQNLDSNNKSLPLSLNVSSNHTGFYPELLENHQDLNSNNRSLPMALNVASNYIGFSLADLGWYVWSQLKWFDDKVTNILGSIIPIKMAYAEEIKIEPDDLNFALKKIAVNGTVASKELDFGNILLRIILEHKAYELNEESIVYLEQILADSSKYREGLLLHDAMILAKYLVNFSTNPAQIDFIIDLVKSSNTPPPIKELILGKIANEIKLIGPDPWNNPSNSRVLINFAKLLPYDSNSKGFTQNFLNSLDGAYEKYRYAISDSNLLPYFENLMGENKLAIEIVTNSLEKLWPTQSVSLKPHLDILLGKTGKLPLNLLNAIFNQYELDPNHYTDLIKRLVAEERNLPVWLVAKLIKPVSEINDPKTALFIATRLIQYHQTLPITTIRYFLTYLSSDDYGARNLAINFCRTYLNQIGNNTSEVIFQDKEEISKALDRYVWKVPEISKSYLESFNNFVDSFAFSSNKFSFNEQKIVETSYEQIIKRNLKLLPTTLNWPADFLYNYIKNADPDEQIDRMMLLGVLADYALTPEAINREGTSILELLTSAASNSTLVKVNQLIFKDLHFFIEKDVDTLLSELAENNQHCPKIIELVNNGYFKKQLFKIESIKDAEWLGKDYPILGGITKPLWRWEAEDFRKFFKGIDYEKNVAEAIAAVSQASRKEVFKGKYHSRMAQDLALLIMLKFPYGFVLEIGSGEGKTRDLASFITIKTLKEGRRFDVITSNGVLALRDSNQYKNFYEFLNIAIANNVAVDHQEGLKGLYSKHDVIYGEINGFIGDGLRDITDEVKEGRPNDALFTDETDSLLIDRNSWKVQLAKPIPGTESLNHLLIYIWGAVKSALMLLYKAEDNWYIKHPLEKEQLLKLRPDATILQENGIDFGLIDVGLNASNIYPRIHDSVAEHIRTKIFAFDRSPSERAFIVPEDKVQYVQDELSNWIRSAYLSLLTYRRDVQYIVDEGSAKTNQNKFNKVIPIDLGTGEHQENLRWSDGQHQFIEMKDLLALSFTSEVSCFKSFYGFIENYHGSIFGVTGTSGDSETHKFFKEAYGVETIIIPLFMYKDLIELPEIAVLGEDEWYSAIANDIYTTVISRGRAVLVVMETVEQVKILYEQLIRQLSFNDQVTIFKYGTGVNDPREFNVGDELTPGTIIVATPLAGRGTDLALNSELLNNGGLHVIMTSCSTSSRDARQIEHRAGRKGEPGTFRHIYNKSNLKDGHKSLEEQQNADKKKVEKELQASLQKKLPFLNILDRVFDLHTALIRDLDSPTGYQLKIGKPNNLSEGKPFTFYLYQENQKIMLAVFGEKPPESKLIDLTEQINVIDPKVRNHLSIILSNPRANAASLSNQDYEVISFLAVDLGYRKDSTTYNKANEALEREILGEGRFTGFMDWIKKELGQYDPKEVRTAYFKSLVKNNLKYKDLQHDKKVIDEKILARARMRKLFEHWLLQRKGSNQSPRKKQEAETWSYWFKVFSDPLVKLTYEEDGDPQELEKKSQEFIHEYEKYALKISGEWGQATFVKNPFYLVVGAYEKLDSDVNAAVALVDQAERLNNSYNWITKTASANLHLIRDGIGLDKASEATNENMRKAYFLKSTYYRKTQEAIDNLEGIEIPNYEKSLTVLLAHGGATFDSASYRQQVGYMAMYRRFDELEKHNLEVIRGASGNDYAIQIKKVLNITEIVNKINITAAIIQDRLKRGDSARLIVKDSLVKASGDLDFPGSKMIIDQIAASGGMIVEIEAFKLEEPEKDWFKTFITGLISVAFITTGALFGGMGSVFMGVLSKGLIAKGIGDLISVGIQIATKNPTGLKEYLKHSLYSVGIMIVTAGFLDILDKITGGLRILDKVADRTFDAVKGTTTVSKEALLVNHPWKYVGLNAVTQAAMTTASIGLYDLGRKTISKEDIQKQAENAYNEMLAFPNYQNFLKAIFITDRFNQNNYLLNSLVDNVAHIVNKYLDKYENTAINAGEDVAAGTAGYLLDGLVPQVGFGGILRSGFDLSIDLIKNTHAIPDIVSDTKASINEIYKKTSSSGKIFGEELLRLGPDGGKLIDALTTQGYIMIKDSGRSEIDYHQCEQMAKVNLTGIDFDYHNRIVDECKNVERLMLANYDPEFSQFKNSFTGLCAGTVYEIRKETIKPIANILGQTGVSFLSDKIQESISKKGQEQEQNDRQLKEMREHVNPINREFQQLLAADPFGDLRATQLEKPSGKISNIKPKPIEIKKVDPLISFNKDIQNIYDNHEICEAVPFFSDATKLESIGNVLMKPTIELVVRDVFGTLLPGVKHGFTIFTYSNGRKIIIAGYPEEHKPSKNLQVVEELYIKANKNLFGNDWAGNENSEYKPGDYLHSKKHRVIMKIELYNDNQLDDYLLKAREVVKFMESGNDGGRFDYDICFTDKCSGENSNTVQKYLYNVMGIKIFIPKDIKMPGIEGEFYKGPLDDVVQRTGEVIQNDGI